MSEQPQIVLNPEGGETRAHRPLPELARELIRLTDMVVQNGHCTYALGHLKPLRREIKAAHVDVWSQINLAAWEMLAQAASLMAEADRREWHERSAHWAIIAGALRGMVLEDIKGLEQ